MDKLKNWAPAHKNKNNLDKFVISEGEFVKIKPGVVQLPVEELQEVENDNTRNKDNSPSK